MHLGNMDYGNLIDINSLNKLTVLTVRKLSSMSLKELDHIKGLRKTLRVLVLERAVCIRPVE